MSKKKLIHYRISRIGYERERIRSGGWHSWANHEIAYKLSTATNIARRMGIGSEILQVSKTPTGKRKYKLWIYTGD